MVLLVFASCDAQWMSDRSLPHGSFAAQLPSHEDLEAFVAARPYSMHFYHAYDPHEKIVYNYTGNCFPATPRYLRALVTLAKELHLPWAWRDEIAQGVVFLGRNFSTKPVRHSIAMTNGSMM